MESDERVILLTAGTLVVQHEDRVYGVGAPPPGMWHITAREDHGPNVYTYALNIEIFHEVLGEAN